MEELIERMCDCNMRVDGTWHLPTSLVDPDQLPEAFEDMVHEEYELPDGLREVLVAILDDGETPFYALRPLAGRDWLVQVSHPRLVPEPGTGLCAVRFSFMHELWFLGRTYESCMEQALTVVEAYVTEKMAEARALKAVQS